jgi:peptidoglycan/LPS O-acetylase OafA/YrhL
MLCWLAVGFAVVAAAAEPWSLSLPRWLIASPAALLWTVPLTLLPQIFMGLFTPGYGPDTSLGLLPQPHVLAYYAIFFGYGALLLSTASQTETIGRRWPVLFALALVVCFPAGLVTMSAPEITALPQVLYAWLMCFAAIGFFRWLVPEESRVWRYLSDSAYWLYLLHLPVVILLQQVSRDWPGPGSVKFLGVCTVATVLLLASYQVLVRHTWLGMLLNGPRCGGQPPASSWRSGRHRRCSHATCRR